MWSLNKIGLFKLDHYLTILYVSLQAVISYGATW